jgi:putative inorganic carbon (hco3(-)) transporter
MENDRKSKLLYLAAIVLSLQPLFFSYSRGAYLAVFCAILVYGVLKTRKLLLVILLIVTLWQVILPTSVVERISMTETDSGELESSAAVRLTLWDNAVKMFYEYPVFGSGFKGFTIAYIKEHWSDTHNFYLKTLCEQGIIGIILLFLILAAAFRSGWRLFKSGTTPFQKGLGYGFLGCVIAHIITNLFGDRFSYYEMGSYFWIFWGAVDRGLLIAKTAEQHAVAQETIPALEESQLTA